MYVVYDDEGGGWAGRFIWLLDVIGHQHYHYLNGGIQAWPADKLSTDAPAPGTSPVRLQLSSAPTATREYLQSRLGANDLVIWDARGLKFNGEKVLAAKGGHIPGAINFEWTAGMDLNDHLRIRKDIADVLRQLGITPTRK